MKKKSLLVPFWLVANDDLEVKQPILLVFTPKQFPDQEIPKPPIA